MKGTHAHLYIQTWDLFLSRSSGLATAAAGDRANLNGIVPGSAPTPTPKLGFVAVAVPAAKKWLSLVTAPGVVFTVHAVIDLAVLGTLASVGTSLIPGSSVKVLLRLLMLWATNTLVPTLVVLNKSESSSLDAWNPPFGLP